MISIWALIGHGLWISGLAVLLAIKGLQSWERSSHGPHHVGVGWSILGLLLIAGGLLITRSSPLEHGLWAALTLALAGVLGGAALNTYRQRKRHAMAHPEAQRSSDLLRSAWSSPQSRWIIGTLVSAGALYLAFRGVDYSSVGATLLRANTTFIMLALISVTINTLTKAVRWQVLIGDKGRSISLLEILRVLLISQMLNTIIPARIGELSRAYMIGRRGPGSAFILGTVALEKLIDIILYLILFVLLILLMPVPAWISQPIYPFSIIAVGCLLTALLMSRYQHELLGIVTRLLHWLPNRLQDRMARLVGSALASLSILKNWQSSLSMGWWSAIIWITAVLNNYLILRALSIVAPPPAALLVIIVLQAGIAIPSVPGKIGVFQYLCILALDVFAIDRTLSLSYGVLLQAIVFLPTTAIGIILFWASGLTLRGSASMVVSETQDTLPPQAID